jgi:hypothetical protein
MVKTRRPPLGRAPRGLRGAGAFAVAGGLGLALAACGAPPVHNSPAETALVKQIRQAILAKGTVRVVIHRHQKGKNGVEILAGDIGTKSADESITHLSARASIRITPTAAYFTGNPQGLKTFLGLSDKEVGRVGHHWVEDKAGSKQYKELFQADTMSSLPDSLLPTSSDAVKMSSSTVGGVKVKVLSWTESASGQKISEQLFVPAAGAPLPLSENTNVNPINQTTAFYSWGEHLHVVAPPAADVIAYSQVTVGAPAPRRY